MWNQKSIKLINDHRYPINQIKILKTKQPDLVGITNFQKKTKTNKQNTDDNLRQRKEN